LFSSKATVGTGNAVVATSENAAAVSGSVLSLFIPVIVAVLLLLLIGWIIVKLGRRLVPKKSLENKRRAS
jgi:flagellar biogenesis protein FliO